MPETSPIKTRSLFAVVCLFGIAALIYFAHSAALQSTPAYSTLNTNPDGAKLLFDGLKQAGFVQVSRQFKSVALEKPLHSSIFFLGVEAIHLQFAEEPYFNEMENSANRGNGLIIALLHDEDGGLPYIEHHKAALIETRWGVRLASSDPILDMSWQAVAPGVWTRNFGRGSISLVANGQRLSNKGVATSEENRQLLRQLVGNYSSAVFEEAHLGIVETGSIAGLARRYHLQGLIGGLILVAALFVWSRSVSFPPMPPPPEKTLLGSDTRSMLTELMSRHLKGQLMTTCVAEWNRTRAHAPALQLPEENNVVAAYTKLQESLQNRAQFTL